MSPASGRGDPPGDAVGGRAPAVDGERGAAGGWVVTTRSGSAAELHGLGLPADGRRHVWVLEPGRPALVLGSTQTDAVADGAALAAGGVELARRRSGGGAVLLVPGRSLWVDVVIPRDDPLWDDDVTASFAWLGRAWCRALAAVGVTGQVHRGPPVRRRWGRLVCFAGVGAGEVAVRGRKVVGLSQRRTREAARFQSVVDLGAPGTAPAAETVRRLAEPADPAERDELVEVLRGTTAAVAAGRGALLAALLDSLPPD